MKIKAYRSPDKRVRTEMFKSRGETFFCVAEPTAWGTLVSKFKTSGEIVDRVENKRTHSAASALDMYLTGFAMVEFVETNSFEHIKVQATCSTCGGSSIERELDSMQTEKMQEIQVVPIFVCNGCGTRFCLVGDEYVKNMIAKYSHFIEMGRGESAENSAFIGSARDNIIRSFASQNIKKLEIKANA